MLSILGLFWQSWSRLLQTAQTVVSYGTTFGTAIENISQHLAM